MIYVILCAPYICIVIALVNNSSLYGSTVIGEGMGMASLTITSMQVSWRLESYYEVMSEVIVEECGRIRRNTEYILSLLDNGQLSIALSEP